MEPTIQTVAQKVRELLSDKHPSGMTIEVVEAQIRKMETWWQVPVRPDFWPEKTFEYYDTLADVETELLEQSHLNILLSPLEPLEQQAA